MQFNFKQAVCLGSGENKKDYKLGLHEVPAEHIELDYFKRLVELNLIVEPTDVQKTVPVTEIERAKLIAEKANAKKAEAKEAEESDADESSEDESLDLSEDEVAAAPKSKNQGQAKGKRK